MSVKMDIKGNGIQGKLGAATPPPKSLWRSIKRLLGYMKKSSLLILLCLVIAIIGTVMQVVTPKMLGSATTVIFAGLSSNAGIDFTALGAVLATVAILYAGVFIATFLQERIMTVVSLKTVQVLRNEVKSKLNRVPISFFDKHANGDLMSLAINDIDNIATNLQQSLTTLISSAILIVGIFAIMITISPLLTLLACVMIPATMIIAKLFTPFAQKHNKTYVKSMGTLNGKIEETYQGFAVVKAFNGEQEAIDAFCQSNEEMCRSGWLAKFFGGSMMHLMMLVQNAIYVLIASIGAIKVISGGILIGDLQAFLQYSQQFTSPVTKLSQIWASLLAAVASAERIFALLDAEEMTPPSELPASVTGTAAKVTFEDVQFSYTKDPLLTDFSLAVEEGQMIAIVGHTGAGKTTLVNLLERFYEIQGGAIAIDGADIRSLSHQQLRRQIGMVLQDTWLFAGTIYDNIKFGNENATDEEILTAAQAAFADDFIQKLPEGYLTELSEEASNLSQGQKQLLTIARAFVANPDILVLDEATSNVDSRTEMVIQQAMRRLLKGRTSFVVAHRLSTIYDADLIIVMEQGQIVETGTHQELIRLDGKYADIYNSQFATQKAA